MTEKSKKPLIVTNTSNKPIFIHVGVTADPYGGPGISDITHLIAPDDEIDLKILGLEEKRDD